MKTAHKERGGKMYFGPKEHADPPGDMQGKINELIDTALVETRATEYAAIRGASGGEVAQKRIGSGYIGLKCVRQLAMKYHKVEANESGSFVSPGALNRHGEAGHWTEAATAEWLRLSGFDLLTHKIAEDGSPILDRFGKPKQFGYYSAKHPETGQAQMAGEVDGVIVGVPDSLTLMIPTPCIWESKKATAKKFKNFSSKGVKEADTKYYGQVQTNMAYMGIEHTLFSMLNLDNMEFYWELIPFDVFTAQFLTDRAVSILQSQSPYEFPRITTDPSDWHCKFCPYTDPCWNEPREGRPEPATLPHWLKSKA